MLIINTVKLQFAKSIIHLLLILIGLVIANTFKVTVVPMNIYSILHELDNNNQVNYCFFK